MTREEAIAFLVKLGIHNPRRNADRALRRQRRAQQVPADRLNRASARGSHSGAIRRAIPSGDAQPALASAAWRARNARVLTAATETPSSLAISVSVRPSP